MEKKVQVTTHGEFKYDETKNEFTGFIAGEKAELKQGKNGKWYLSTSKLVTLFDIRSNDQDHQG